MFKKISRPTKFLLIASSGLLMAGCGFHSAQSAPAPVAHHHKKSAPAAAPSPSPSGSPSPSLAPSSASSASQSVGPSHSAAPSTTPSLATTAHVPPGAGPYTGLSISVVQAVGEGQYKVAGHSLNAYLLTLKISNPTSGMVALSLNDFSTVDGRTPYTWNDEDAQGLTSSNSLFSLPVTPASPNSDVTQILPGQPLTRDITVLVPPAPVYHVDWNGTDTAVGPDADFSS